MTPFLTNPSSLTPLSLSSYDECLSWFLFNLLKELFWRCNLDPKLLASGEVAPIECHNILHSSGYSRFQHHVVPGVRERRTPQEKYLLLFAIAHR